MGATVLMIGGKAKPEPAKGDDEDKAEGEDSTKLGDEARKQASRDIIRAVKMGDPDALDKALEAHYEACEGARSDEAE
jgi:DNA-binding FadR family transcriptional regulator